MSAPTRHHRARRSVRRVWPAWQVRTGVLRGTLATLAVLVVWPVFFAGALLREFGRRGGAR